MTTNDAATAGSTTPTQPRATTEPTGISVDDARSRRDELIAAGFSKKDPVLLDALPSIGKSYGVIKWAAETGNPLTVFTSRRTLFDQLQGWCEDLGLSSFILPSSHRHCPTANTDNDKTWAKRMKDAYRTTGLLPGELHQQAETLFGESLPCQKDGECAYFDARDFDSDEYDVIIGHYLHAYVPNRSEDRYVAFDELPQDDYLTNYDADRVATAVNAYLDSHDALPFDYKKDLLEYRRDPERKKEGVAWFKENNRALERDVASAQCHASGDGHPDAAAMTYALLVAEDLENRWEYAKLSEWRTAILSPKNESLTILTRPDLTSAKGVVALDGAPAVTNWRLLLGDDLQHHPLMTNQEKQAYIRDTLGLKLIQTTQAANHYSGRTAISVTPRQDLVVFDEVARRENARPALISTKAAFREYGEDELDTIVGKREHYGNLKGLNEFSETRVGIVAGSTHYGDETIADWAALVGVSAVRTPNTKGMGQDFGDLGNAILEGMRENEVLQAVMRFGRDAGGATVYVHTAALPDWVECAETASEIRKWSVGMQEVIDTIRVLDIPEWRTKHIAQRISTVGDRQVLIHLKSLEQFGYLSHREVGTGFTWYRTNFSEIGNRGHVDWNANGAGPS